jgi:hypothetical protein
VTELANALPVFERHAEILAAILENPPDSATTPREHKEPS